MLKNLIYFDLKLRFSVGSTNPATLSGDPKQQFFEAINYPATVLPFPLKANNSCAFVTSRF